MVIDTNNSINTTGPRGRSSNGVSNTPPETTRTGTTEQTGKGKDDVVLSSEAQNLNRLQASISNMPDVDMERVAAIKQAIAEGKFEINAERIAENMLNQETLLG